MLVVVMGVSGSGKTAVGRQLAEQLSRPGREATFADADDFHPQANKDKMAAGIALTDQDRAGWLDALKDLLASWHATHRTGVLACSALKKVYRDRLRTCVESSDAAPTFAFLQAPYEIIHARMEERQNHYMPSSLLKSQFETLEAPSDDEPNVIVIDASQPLKEVVAQIIAAIGEQQPQDTP